jgi:hypothetical protein
MARDDLGAIAEWTLRSSRSPATMVGMTDPQIVPPAPPPPPAPTGNVGKHRGVGVTILLMIVTFGIYAIVWQYFVFEENKKWSGEGVGGIVGLLFALFCSIVNIFLLPYEIKNNYERDRRGSPVSVATGFWILLPLLGIFIWVWRCQSAMNDFWASKGAPAR